MCIEGVEGYLLPQRHRCGRWLLIQPSRTHLSKSVCRDWGYLSYFHEAWYSTSTLNSPLPSKTWEERNIKYRPKECPLLLAACPCEAFQFLWSQHHPTVCLIILEDKKKDAVLLGVNCVLQRTQFLFGLISSILQVIDTQTALGDSSSVLLEVLQCTGI